MSRLLARKKENGGKEKRTKQAKKKMCSSYDGVKDYIHIFYSLCIYMLTERDLEL